MSKRSLPPNAVNGLLRQSSHPTLRASEIDLSYDRDIVVHELSVEIPQGKITTIVGANASGKSTLLRALARLLAPVNGHVYLGEREIRRQRSRDVAQQLTLLPQSPIAPDGITVSDLVGRGRYPYQSLLRPWSPQDTRAVAAAMEATGVTDLAERPVNQLSGGQRQRVWVAMALAQETPLLLLDEPTTFLDLSHQIEVLDLLKELNQDTGQTVVLVLHDLNLASRYSDHLIAMADGRIAAEGAPQAVITESIVREVFGLEATIVPDPVSSTPLLIPIGRTYQAACRDSRRRRLPMNGGRIDHTAEHRPDDHRKDHHVRRTTLHFAMLMTALLVTALFAVACGSDDEQQQASSTSQTAAPAEQQQQAAQQAEQPQQEAQQAQQIAQPQQQASASQQASDEEPQEQQAVAQAAEDDQQDAQPAEQSQQQAQQQAASSQSSQQVQAAAVRSFTDDWGTTFETVSDQPVVVAEAGVAAALMEFGVTPVGVFGQTEDSAGNPYGGADFTGIEFVGGDAYGEIGLEALAELNPDVVVTITWGESYWWLSADLIDEVTQIAPLLLISVSDGATGVPAPQVIARFEELSLVLGGTGGSEADKAIFSAAEEAVRAAVAERPGVTLMFASASTDTFYVADPPPWPDLSYYVSLGVDVLRTETTEGGYWEYQSLESIDKYDVDHILLDDRDPLQGERLQSDVPLWVTLPAVQAEQVSLWPIAGRVYTYAGIAKVLNHIAEVINSSSDVG